MSGVRMLQFLKRFIEIHWNPPILYYGFNLKLKRLTFINNERVCSIKTSGSILIPNSLPIHCWPKCCKGRFNKKVHNLTFGSDPDPYFVCPLNLEYLHKECSNIEGPKICETKWCPILSIKKTQVLYAWIKELRNNGISVKQNGVQIIGCRYSLFVGTKDV